MPLFVLRSVDMNAIGAVAFMRQDVITVGGWAHKILAPIDHDCLVKMLTHRDSDCLGKAPFLRLLEFVGLVKHNKQ